MNSGDAPDVVEDDVVVRAFGDHPARLEYVAGEGRADELGELVLGDQIHDRVVARHTALQRESGSRSADNRGGDRCKVVLPVPGRDEIVHSSR